MVTMMRMMIMIRRRRRRTRRRGTQRCCFSLVLFVPSMLASVAAFSVVFALFAFIFLVSFYFFSFFWFCLSVFSLSLIPFSFQCVESIFISAPLVPCLVLFLSNFILSFLFVSPFFLSLCLPLFFLHFFFLCSLL